MLVKWLKPKTTQVIEEHAVKEALALARFKRGSEDFTEAVEKIDRKVKKAPVEETVPPSHDFSREDD